MLKRKGCKELKVETKEQVKIETVTVKEKDLAKHWDNGECAAQGRTTLVKGSKL